MYAVAVGGAGRGEGPEKEDGTGLASVVRRFEWRRQLEAGHLPDQAFLHNTTHATETEQLLSADKLCGYYETGSLKQVFPYNLWTKSSHKSLRKMFCKFVETCVKHLRFCVEFLNCL